MIQVAFVLIIIYKGGVTFVFIISNKGDTSLNLLEPVKWVCFLCLFALIKEAWLL